MPRARHAVAASERLPHGPPLDESAARRLRVQGFASCGGSKLPLRRAARASGERVAVSLPPGAPLLRKGEAWDALYIVCSGSLEDRGFQANKKVKVKGLGEVKGIRGRTIRAGEHTGEEALALKPGGQAAASSAAAKRVPSSPADSGGGGLAATSRLRVAVDRAALPLNSAQPAPPSPTSRRATATRPVLW